MEYLQHSGRAKRAPQAVFRHSRFCLLLMLTLWLAAQPQRGFESSFGQAASAAQNSAQPPQTLELGKALEREIAGAETHAYRITLAAEQYFRVTVLQKGIDAVVTLLDPAGKQIAEVDGPTGTQGTETVSAISEAAGDHRLEVRPLEKTAPAGRYEIRLALLRNATTQDKGRVAAERAIAEAETLRTQNTAESRSKAIVKYEESLPLWRTAEDRLSEANAVFAIARLHQAAGNKQRALDYLNQGVPQLRNGVNRNQEAGLLGAIAAAYSSLNQPEKALEYYNQALQLHRELNNRQGEATTLERIGGIHLTSGERQKAIDSFEQARQRWRALNNPSQEGLLLNNAGFAFSQAGEWHKAIECFEQALPLHRAVNNIRGEATTRMNLAATFEKLGEYQKSLDQANEVLRLARSMNDPQREMVAFNWMSAVYTWTGE
jgi:tetratricopeptide (TPR) repeat protein